MKFTCDKSIINETVSTVSKAANASSAVELLKGIKIDAGSVLTMTGSDMEISIEREFAADITEPGSIIIDARLFADVVRRLPEGNVAIETKDRGEVLISCGQVKYNLLYLSSDGYPAIQKVQDGMSLKVYSRDIKEMVKNTLFAVSTSDARPILTGCKFEVAGSRLSVVAIDGYRLAKRNQVIPDTGIADASFVIPGRVLNELLKILRDDETIVELLVSGNAVMFRFDGYCFVSRLLEGEFIDYSRIIPPSWTTRLNVDVRQLGETIERAAVIINYDDPRIPIALGIADSRLTVDCTTKRGTLNEGMAADQEGDNLKIRFSSRFLLDALKAVDAERAYLEFTSDQSPCVVRPIEGDSFLYMVLPVRPN